MNGRHEVQDQRALSMSSSAVAGRHCVSDHADCLRCPSTSQWRKGENRQTEQGHGVRGDEGIDREHRLLSRAFPRFLHQGGVLDIHAVADHCICRCLGPTGLELCPEKGYRTWYTCPGQGGRAAEEAGPPGEDCPDWRSRGLTDWRGCRPSD